MPMGRNYTRKRSELRISNNNGVTFGPMLMLATNGTIGETAEEEEPEEGE
jgi:hypothetical protein